MSESGVFSSCEASAVKRRDWLKAAGCHEAQGYWYARPLEAAAATEWLRQVAAAGGRVLAAGSRS